MPSVGKKAECRKVLREVYANRLDEDHWQSLRGMKSALERILAALVHEHAKVRDVGRFDAYLQTLPPHLLQEIARQHRKLPGKRGPKGRQLEDLSDRELVILKSMHARIECDRMSQDGAAALAIEWVEEQPHKRSAKRMANLKKFYQRWHQRAYPILEGVGSPEHQDFMSRRPLRRRMKLA